MRRHFLAGTVMLLGLTLVLGFGYPLLVTGLSALLFRHQADGSLVYRGGKLAGSSLLRQSFTDSKGNPILAGLYRFALAFSKPPVESAHAPTDLAPKPDVFVIKLER